MKALLLNSGLGSRMGKYTENNPKTMVSIGQGETILSRQLRQLEHAGITDIVITTGSFEELLTVYVKENFQNLKFSFVRNDRYAETNYIYSMYLAREQLNADILLMHGDLVFDDSVLSGILQTPGSCVAVSTTMPLPQKDFKGVVCDGFIRKIGIEFFENAVMLQPLYKFIQSDFKLWMKSIEHFCENGNTACYAENAFNEIGNLLSVSPYDFQNRLCAEIDNEMDLKAVRKIMQGENV